MVGHGLAYPVGAVRCGHRMLAARSSCLLITDSLPYRSLIVTYLRSSPNKDESASPCKLLTFEAMVEFRNDAALDARDTDAITLAERDELPQGIKAVFVSTSGEPTVSAAKDAARLLVACPLDVPRRIRSEKVGAGEAILELVTRLVLVLVLFLVPCSLPLPFFGVTTFIR